ncbi:MAG TPA: DUF6600 domain-containing protein, partial [Thermoanaerobaculia bacterium]|nr:DUF6600 domain-containing protein [Thermoanaerobaculia bacterium]
ASALRASNDEAGDAGELDDNLRYQAATLASYGSWVRIEGNRYWRPRVEAGWRPYWHGRWAYTPAGLTWIAYEPWGWVPFHYGSWNYLDGYGWVWQPGYVWSPAWVYWYWGPSYVGWCPTGFYTSYYGAQFGVDFGFRSGVYGWAGGDWGLFDRWSFVGSGYFRDGYRAGYTRGYWDGRRDVQRYAVPIEHVRGHGLERGVITTDTKPLRPNTWHDQGAVLHALNVHPNGPEDHGTHQGRGTGVGGREIPDVTPFIARKPLSTEVVQTVGARSPGHGQDGTPFKPATLGKPGRPAGDHTWTRTGTTGDAPGAKPGSRPGRTVAEGEKPGRPGRPADPGATAGAAPGGTTGGPTGRPTGRPADNGAVDNGRPRTWERPARPAPNADGGAPKPRAGSGDKPDTSTVDNGRPVRTERPANPDRPQRPAATDDNRRPPAEPKPTWTRPAPEAGGAPKPDRSPAAEKPRVEPRREPERPKAEPRPERIREPEKPKAEPRREPEKPKENDKPKPPPPSRGN